MKGLEAVWYEEKLRNDDMLQLCTARLKEYRGTFKYLKFCDRK